MRVLVTCGPTYESLDEVRRLTNFSTGKLGIGLANHLVAAGHEVVLLKGYYAICPDRSDCTTVVFTTTDDLMRQIESLSTKPLGALFHSAAVSDFKFGSVFRREPNGTLVPEKSGKFGTRAGNLLAELVPTTKIIGRLRGLFPNALLFGWKYEVDGNRDSAIELGRGQVTANKTDYSVVNGPAYGPGFGVVSPAAPVQHCPSAEVLYQKLVRLLGKT